jgi:hypothetical protein
MLAIDTSLSDKIRLSPGLESILQQSGAFLDDGGIQRSSSSAFVPVGTTPSHKKNTEGINNLPDPITQINNENKYTLQQIFCKLSIFGREYNSCVNTSHVNTKISNWEIFSCYIIAIYFVLSLQQKHIDINALNVDVVARTIIIISRKKTLKNCSEPILFHYIQIFCSSLQTKIFCMERYIKSVIVSHSDNLLYNTVNDIILRVVKKRERCEYNRICIMVQWILCNIQHISIDKTVKIACYIVFEYSQHSKIQYNIRDRLELTSNDLELTMLVIFYYNSIAYYNVHI